MQFRPVPSSGSDDDEEESLDGAQEYDDSVLDESVLTTLTVPQLKEKLREAGLPVSGRKSELVERLLSSEA